MTKKYYIDSENVGDSWIELLNNSENELFIFYTKNSPRMTYSQVIRLMNAPIHPNFIECVTGNNGLDFQLVTYLGYNIHETKTDEFIIVSKDTGFDAVVSFWKKRKVNIQRISQINSSKNELASNKKCSNKKLEPSSLSLNAQNQISDVKQKEIWTIINCIGKDNSNYIHLVFEHFYGQKKGNEIYKYLRKLNFEVLDFQWDKTTKIKKIIKLILHYRNKSKRDIPESFIDFLVNHANSNRKLMRESIIAQYPVEGENLYSMIKPFLTTLVNIS